MVEFEVVDWERCQELCFKLYTKVEQSGYIPDVIIGLARGGWIPARILSDFFTRDISTMRIEFYRGVNEPGDQPQLQQPLAKYKEWRKPLVVDDIVDTGSSLAVALEHLETQGFEEIRTASLHVKPKTKLMPDYFMIRTSTWVVYPWEIAEFTVTIAEQFSKQGIPFEEIEAQLLRIGLPEPYFKYFFKLWKEKQQRD